MKASGSAYFSSQRVALNDLPSSERAFTLLREVAAFIAFVQREDGHWGQRYEVSGDDKSIYRQEDNVAHGGAALATYLLTANALGREVPDWEELLELVLRGAQYALKNYYRPEIHLFYSTTSVHESAMEKGYSLWVNFAYLQLLYLMAELDKVNGHKEEMDAILQDRNSFRRTCSGSSIMTSGLSAG